MMTDNGYDNSHFSFEFLSKDDLVAKVSVDGNKVHVDRISKDPFDQWFYKENMDLFELNDILSGRVFSPEREDAGRLLQNMGLKVFSPIDICRKTHGVKRDDYLWIRFEGEDLHAIDVLTRMQEEEGIEM